MKKKLLLVFVLISTYGFSHQVLKKITDTSQFVIVDLYFFANGTNNQNFIGPKNWARQENPNDLYNLFDGNGNYSTVTDYGTHILPNQVQENLCLTTMLSNGYIWAFGNTASYENTILTLNINSLSYQIKINSYLRKADTNHDGEIDCYKETYYIPKILANGNAIPSNLFIIIGGLRDGWIDYPYIETNIYYSALVLKFDGSNWVYQYDKYIDTNSSHYSPFYVSFVNDICISNLNINEIKNSKDKISIYPNPANNFITLQNSAISKENFQYKIIDLTGRVVKIGNSQYNEQINIESLKSGNYIIQIQTDSNQYFTEKLIKN